jgi:hypothetical protein
MSAQPNEPSPDEVYALFHAVGGGAPANDAALLEAGYRALRAIALAAGLP